jgi:hypothetical protein
VNSKSKFLPLILFLALLGVGVEAWTQHSELVKLRADLLLPNQTADFNRRLAAEEKKNRDLLDQLAALRKQGDGTNVADDGTAAAGADQNAGARRGRGGFANFQAMMNNPEFQKLMAVQQKAALDGRYASLFKNLNLTPDQLEQFKNLLVQKQQAMQDARAAAIQQGLNPRTDPQGFQQAVQSAQAAVDTQIQATLGDAGFAQYQQYQQTLPQRTTVTAVQQSLSYSQTPLTDDQANQLIQLMAQNSSGNGGGGGGGRGGFGGQQEGAPITAAVITQAQSILSAPQVQALQQVQQQQQAQQQMQRLIRASAGSNGGGGARAGGG